VAAAKIKEIVVSDQKDKKLEKKETINKGSIKKETIKDTETKK